MKELELHISNIIEKSCNKHMTKYMRTMYILYKKYICIYMKTYCLENHKN